MGLSGGTTCFHGEEWIATFNMIAPLGVQSGYGFVISTFLNSCIAIQRKTVMALFIISSIIGMREVKHGYKRAEYKDTGRKMFNTYLDINDPYGSIYRMKITATCYQHLFSKS